MGNHLMRKAVSHAGITEINESSGQFSEEMTFRQSQ